MSIQAQFGAQLAVRDASDASDTGDPGDTGGASAAKQRSPTFPLKDMKRDSLD
ncbi:hypothetical protein E4U59_003458 [Claviceps monticola]|nr:hypothetical protein E4U59_003458 [Claviceps monticola]